MTLPVRVDGPDTALNTLVLAHGAGSGMDHPFLTAAAHALAAPHLRVVRFEFPYRAAKKRMPDRMPTLMAAMREVAVRHGRGKLCLGGKSMGGRVATMLADELAAAAVIVFGYPFHPPAKPEQLRTTHLRTLETPTLILQGERDPFGTHDEVATYDLSAAITVQWFADGDHDLAPRARSGHESAGHQRAAFAAAAAFVAQRLA
jgi:uncharacterized protein